MLVEHVLYVCVEGDGGDQIKSDNVLYGLAANMVQTDARKYQRDAKDSDLILDLIFFSRKMYYSNLIFQFKENDNFSKHLLC